MSEAQRANLVVSYGVNRRYHAVYRQARELIVNGEIVWLNQPPPTGTPTDGTSGTFAVPRLRIEVSYDLRPGERFLVDSFVEQHNDPLTDHAFFVNAMPTGLMADVVECLNQGRRCGSPA